MVDSSWTKSPGCKNAVKLTVTITRETPEFQLTNCMCDVRITAHSAGQSGRVLRALAYIRFARIRMEGKYPYLPVGYWKLWGILTGPGGLMIMGGGYFRGNMSCH